MIVEVYYGDLHVATVDAPRTTTDEALEYAFRWTQNIEGSWSKPNNADTNDAVTVRAPLRVSNGYTYGHRSSMVGDRLVIGDLTWRVDSFGFSLVSNVGPVA